MVKTQIKTKTAVVVALTVLSIGSMLAGLYYYGARVQVNPPAVKQPVGSTPAQNAPQGAAQNNVQNTTQLPSGETVGIIGGATSGVKFAVISTKDVSGTLDGYCKSKSYTGSTGLVMVGPVSNDAPLDMAILLESSVSSSLAKYAAYCRFRGPCDIQCYSSESTVISAVNASSKLSATPDDFCKDAGYSGSTGIGSAPNSHDIPELIGTSSLSTSGGFGTLCKYRGCVVQCYKNK